MQNITSWSFSRYADYQQCPLKAKLKFIDRIKEPPNAAMQRGVEIHNLAEAFIKGELDSLPNELRQFSKLFRRLRRKFSKRDGSLIIEDTWAFTASWTPTTWDDWSGCRVRIKVDCAERSGNELIVRDWKTGKYRPEKHAEYLEQLQLYALGGLLSCVDVERVRAELVYLDIGQTHPGPDEPAIFYTRDQLDDLISAWERRVKPMLSDTCFAPRPSNLCNWCFFRQSNRANGGGQCQFY